MTSVTENVIERRRDGTKQGEGDSCHAKQMNWSVVRRRAGRP
ncbi:hypothetical protein ACFLWS_02570 [Chloroflexota bacterium]